MPIIESDKIERLPIIESDKIEHLPIIKFDNFHNAGHFSLIYSTRTFDNPLRINDDSLSASCSAAELCGNSEGNCEKRLKINFDLSFSRSEPPKTRQSSAGPRYTIPRDGIIRSSKTPLIRRVGYRDVRIRPTIGSSSLIACHVARKCIVPNGTWRICTGLGRP